MQCAMCWHSVSIWMPASDLHDHIISMENLGKSGKKSDFGSGGVLGAIFIVNIMKRIVQKLCRTILLHFGLVFFRIHFGKTKKVTISMFFGFGGLAHDSPNQCYSSLETPGYSKWFKKNPESFLLNILFGNLRKLKIASFENVGTDWGRQSRRSV